MPRLRLSLFRTALNPLLTGAAVLLLATGAIRAQPLGSQAELSDWGVDRGSLRAVLMPVEDVRLSSRAAGVVERYLVREGERVSAGQILMELNREQEKAEVAQSEAALKAAEAELTRASKEFARAELLRTENISSEKQYEEATYQLALAEAARDRAEAALSGARDRLEARTIKSPIDGLFFKRSKSVGEAVAQFETVARVIDDSELELVVYAGSSLFGTLQPNRSATVEVMDGPGRGTKVPGTITHVDSLVDPASGTFRIKVRVEPSSVAGAGFAARLLLEPAA